MAKKINSRAKGADGERELAHILREYGYTGARRGQQFSGANGDPDVVGLPGVHIESKRVERLNIDSAMEQAIRDARDDEIPCVFHRKNRKPWKVTMLLEDWMNLYKKQIPLQPEIIKCKECRYSAYDFIFHSRYCHHKGKVDLVGDDFFCAAGRYMTNGSD